MFWLLLALFSDRFSFTFLWFLSLISLINNFVWSPNTADNFFRAIFLDAINCDRSAFCSCLSIHVLSPQSFFSSLTVCPRFRPFSSFALLFLLDEFGLFAANSCCSPFTGLSSDKLYHIHLALNVFLIIYNLTIFLHPVLRFFRCRYITCHVSIRWSKHFWLDVSAAPAQLCCCNHLICLRHACRQVDRRSGKSTQSGYSF